MLGEAPAKYMDKGKAIESALLQIEKKFVRDRNAFG